jgi:hypothetical protein
VYIQVSIYPPPSPLVTFDPIYREKVTKEMCVDLEVISPEEVLQTL